MKCPIDGSELQMTERQGIEIDYCPQCRGIWLDRGELDKIIERSAAQAPVSSKRGDDYRLEGSYPYDDEDAKHKKRRSLLGDLFDF
jgi:Zn-finger nucleic acid-binding protein